MHPDDMLSLLQIDKTIGALAERGNGSALFTYGRDLYQNYRIELEKKANNKEKK